MAAPPGLRDRLAALLARPFVRFLVLGGVNTLGTLLAYQLMLFVMPAWLAWALAFVLGIVFTSWAYPRLVFGTAPRLDTSLMNAGYYLTSLAVSEGLLSALTAGFGMSPQWAGIAVVGMMVPVNFLATRFIFRARRAP